MRLKEPYELIEEVVAIKAKKERIKLLQEIATPALKDVLRGTYDERIKWNLPEGDVPFTANTDHSYPSTLNKKHMDFKWFARGGPGDKLPAMKRENIFIGMVEAVHPQDAELLVKMINKKQIHPRLSKKVAQEAFPELII